MEDECPIWYTFNRAFCTLWGKRRLDSLRLQYERDGDRIASSSVDALLVFSDGDDDKLALPDGAEISERMGQ